MAIVPLHTAMGDISDYVSTVEDIARRKETDRKLREQATLPDIASDAIFVRDLELSTSSTTSQTSALWQPVVWQPTSPPPWPLKRRSLLPKPYDFRNLLQTIADLLR